MWFAVHEIQSCRFRKSSADLTPVDRQEYYPLYENIFLVSASSIEAAEKKAIEFIEASRESSDDIDLILDDKPAVYISEGIRKIEPIKLKNGQSEVEDCTWITVSTFGFENKQHIQKFISEKDKEVGGIKYIN